MHCRKSILLSLVITTLLLSSIPSTLASSYSESAIRDIDLPAGFKIRFNYTFEASTSSDPLVEPVASFD